MGRPPLSPVACVGGTRMLPKLAERRPFHLITEERSSSVVSVFVRCGCQNANFTPSCNSRIGVLVELIVPYCGLVTAMFGSPQIG